MSLPCDPLLSTAARLPVPSHRHPLRGYTGVGSPYRCSSGDADVSPPCACTWAMAFLLLRQHEDCRTVELDIEAFLEE
jgi:hypothetical protein